MKNSPTSLFSRVSNNFIPRRGKPIVKRQPLPTHELKDPSGIPENYLRKVSFSPSSTLTNKMGASSILSHSALLVFRELEMLNVFLNYEQANKYSIKTYNGNNVGFIAEEEKSWMGTVWRQILRTRRSFKGDVLDVHGNLVMQISRPMKLFLNSTISISTPEGKEIGKVVSDWHLWRRRYDLFINNEQIAKVDDGLLSWDFTAKDEKGGPIGTINRSFVGFFKEIFTDAGQYVVHYDATDGQTRSLSLDERAVLLACAVTLDIDYFSRHSRNSSFGIIPEMGDIMEGPSTVPKVPTVGSEGGGGVGGVDVFGGSSTGSTGSTGTQPGKNQWGDDILTDQEAGSSDLSDIVDGSSSSFWDIFND